MESTLNDGQIIISHRTFETINYSDIVVFDYPVSETDTVTMIKRVIGLESDTISFRQGSLYINEVEFKGYYIHTHEPIADYTLKQGELFVIGDNALNSTDSREFGIVSESMVLSIYYE